VPARDVYGIRIAPSAFGYKELGGKPASLQGAQHCRAEVYLKRHGWVAMDPADVAKVMRQETPNWIKDPDHPVVAPVKQALFGGWEGNWMGYNFAHDVRLPGLEGRQGRLPDVPAGRKPRRALRLAGAGQLRVHHHLARHLTIHAGHRRTASSERKAGKLIAFAVLASILASTCCVLPLVLVLVGITGAWMVHLTALKPLAPYAIALTLGALGWAGWLLFRPAALCLRRPGLRHHAAGHAQALHRLRRVHRPAAGLSADRSALLLRP
jgi:hypothetical protein